MNESSSLKRDRSCDDNNDNDNDDHKERRKLRTLIPSREYIEHYENNCRKFDVEEYVVDEKDYCTVWEIWEMLVAHEPESWSDHSDVSSVESLPPRGIPSGCQSIDDAVFHCTETFTDGRVYNLALTDVHLCWLPKSIANLTELEILDLSDTFVKYLPNTIGDLIGLEKLILKNTLMKKIPGSIGKLENLVELILFDSLELKKLPNEIGRLTRLEKLNLGGTSVRSLPNSIGNLKNLRFLSLQYTFVKALPDSLLRCWVGLKHLLIENSKIIPLNASDRRLFLQNLVECCPSLCELDRTLLEDDVVEDDAFLHYSLACNRAKNRWFPVSGRHESYEATLTRLWPHMLANARDLFEWDIEYEGNDNGNDNDNDDEHDDDAEDKHDYAPPFERFGTADAMYWLLQNGTHFFVEALSGRNPGGGALLRTTGTVRRSLRLARRAVQRGAQYGN